MLHGTQGCVAEATWPLVSADTFRGELRIPSVGNCGYEPGKKFSVAFRLCLRVGLLDNTEL